MVEDPAIVKTIEYGSIRINFWQLAKGDSERHVTIWAADEQERSKDAHRVHFKRDELPTLAKAILDAHTFLYQG